MNAQLTERQQLTVEVLQLAKDKLLASNPYLAPATSLLPFAPTPVDLSTQAGTDAKTFYFDADQVLTHFAASREAPLHNYAHTLLHCLFLHPFANPGRSRKRWDLACDIATEHVAAQLCGPRPGDIGSRMDEAYKRICSALRGNPFTAESLFELLKNNDFTPWEQQWRELFSTDDHQFWYETPANSLAEEHQSGEAQEREEKNTETSNGDNASSTPKKADADGEKPKNTWQSAAQNLFASISAQRNTPGGGWGKDLSGLSDNLHVKPIGYKKQALDEFLRSFATFEETSQPSSDEFDYALYTYGFKLYNNIPITEPLETKDDKRIREFVIGIDVSGSVWGAIVSRFAQIVQGVLYNEELFSSRPRIRIIQCDTAIVAEDVIDTPEQMQKWIQGIRMSGGGGTDLRPVFNRVDKLIERKEIDDLNGVMFLTDGYATYPENATPYKTAFILTPNGAQDFVPSWAMTFMLSEEDFKNT